MKTALHIESIPLFYDVPLVAIARDAEGRRFVGLAYGDVESEGFAFAQVDRLCEDEFLRGERDLLSLLTTHRAGPVVLSSMVICEGDVLQGDAVDALPAEALPKPGFLMPVAPAGACENACEIV